MHDEEENDRRHSQEVNEAGGVEPAEQPCQLLELPWFPDRKTRQDHRYSGRQNAEIEDLLHGIVDTEAVRKTKAQRGE